MRNLVAIIALSLMGCTTVESGNVGVELSWGHVTGEVFGDGTHQTGPNTDLHIMSVRLQNLEEQDIPCRSKDNVSVSVDV